MSETDSKVPDSATSVAMIREDLTCPDCQYNLRGLSGDVVTCPECGVRCDVATLVTARWTRPWWQAPRFTLAITPAAAAFTGLIVMAVCGGFVEAEMLPWPVVPAVGLVFGAIWFFTMIRTWRGFDDFRGVWLALLAHLLVIGMFGAMLVILVILLNLISGLAWNVRLNMLEVSVNVIVFIAAAAVLYASRLGEKFIAGRCIRAHLADQAKQAAQMRSIAPLQPTPHD